MRVSVLEFSTSILFGSLSLTVVEVRVDWLPMVSHRCKGLRQDTGIALHLDR